ncbi:hypothetical protein [Agromyces larvae]|uniref:Uncharacterized protein n=1 Tax=Agromyces larvae TaxID=2929802 RepID=A0ABY4BUH7_9MICO|nr:hypothetical protein [Agromyces larvae]UOE42829.1 hypothetical protein MTO99_11570 [Agromyces larvae]
MKKRSMAMASLAVAAALVVSAVAPAFAATETLNQICSSPRTQRATVDQTGWGSITFNVTGA